MNDAGVASMSPATGVTLEGWNRVVAVKLTVVLPCARTAARGMIEQREGGKVIKSHRSTGPWECEPSAPGFFPSEMTEAISDDPATWSTSTSRRPGKGGQPR